MYCIWSLEQNGRRLSPRRLVKNQREEGKDTMGKEINFVSADLDGNRVERGGMGFVLASPAGKFIL